MEILREQAKRRDILRITLGGAAAVAGVVVFFATGGFEQDISTWPVRAGLVGELALGLVITPPADRMANQAYPWDGEGDPQAAQQLSGAESLHPSN